MSFTFTTDGPRMSSKRDDEEPHTRILYAGREVGIIVCHDDEGEYHVWISVKKNDPDETPTVLPWKWLHFKERPTLLQRAQELAQSRFEKITAQYQFHFLSK